MSSPFDAFPRTAPAPLPRDQSLPADGLYPSMPMDEYRALSAWGSSDLKTFRIGPPAMVPWKRANGSPDTDATRLGTACHARILEPDLFLETYAFKPEGMTFSSKEGKAWKAEQGGRRIITASDAATVVAVSEAVQSNVRAGDSLEGATHREASILWTCPDSGEPCKARPDWYDADWCYDLKVSRHAGSGLAFRAYVEGWMAQSAHYVFGLRQLGLGAKRGGRLVVVHPKAPHHVYTVEIKSSALDILTLENVNTLRLMRVCREADDWPGTPDEWTPIAPPDYALQLTMGGLDLSDAEEGEAI